MTTLTIIFLVRSEYVSPSHLNQKSSSCITNLSEIEALMLITSGMNGKAGRDEPSPCAAILAATDAAVRAKDLVSS
jgi:ribosomal protein S11